jgi:hypothetical protein
MLIVSELKRIKLIKKLKKIKFRSFVFTKIMIDGIAEVIKNEILILAPELLDIHIKAKS